MQIIRKTDVELVCQEKQPKYIKVLVWVWLIGFSVLLLSLVGLFLYLNNWLVSLLFIVMLVGVTYPAIVMSMVETLTINKVTEQLIYKKQMLFRFQQKVFQLSDIQDIQLERNTNSAGYRYYGFFLLLPSGRHKLTVLYGKTDVERFYQKVRSFLQQPISASEPDSFGVKSRESIDE